MGERIELVNDTKDGKITVDAVYKNDARSPSHVMIEDYRFEVPIRMRLKYDDRSDKLGLTGVSGSEKESVNELIDDEVFVLLNELYGDSIELERWRSLDQVIRHTRDGIDRLRGFVGSIVRNKSEDLF